MVRMKQSKRVIIVDGIDGRAFWQQQGSKDCDWEVTYVDRERDGLSPYERRRYLARVR